MIRLLLLTELDFDAEHPDSPDVFTKPFEELGSGDDPWVVLVAGATADGAEDSFLTLDYAVDSLRRRTLGTATAPCAVAFVPSRRDAGRTGPMRAAERTLIHLWDDIAPTFWEDPGSDERVFVADAFRTFSELTNSTVATVGGASWNQGLLPGDGAGTIEHDGLRCGLIALNTGFRSTAPGIAEQATVGRAQVDASTGGDPSAWAASHDVVCVLMPTPVDALDEASRAALDPLLPGSTHTPLILIGPPTGDDTLGLRDDADGAVSVGAPSFGTVADGRWAVLELARVDGGVQASWRAHPAAGDPQSRFLSVASDRRRTELAPADSDGGRSRARVPSELAAAFLGHLESGRMVAVLGDDFAGPLGSRSKLHENIPSIGEMRPELFRLAFGERPPPNATLDAQELLEAGFNGPRAEEIRVYLEQALEPQPNSVITPQIRLLQAPWARVYDLSVSLVTRSTVDRSPTLAGEIAMIDASREFVAEDAALLEIVQLRGTVNSFDPKSGQPLLRLDGREAGAITGAMSWWRREFAADVNTKPTVFIGGSAAQLWEWIAAREERPRLSPAYLVCEEVPRDVELHLPTLRVEWLPMSSEAFASQFLLQHQEAVEQGRKKRNALLKALRGDGGVRLVSRLRADAPKGKDTEYLRGYEPTWGDIRDNLSLTLRIDARIRQAAAAAPAKPVIVTGRAGTGKTSTLMRLALELDSEGQTVGWIDRGTSDTIPQIIAEVGSRECDVVFVDDADIFGLRTSRFLSELCGERGRQVYAGMRTPRYATLIERGYEHTPVSHDIELSSGEIWQLLDLLSDAGLLGVLRKLKTRHERFRAFQAKSDSELLIGLIEITTGEPFSKRLESEFGQLSERQQRIYSRLALATHLWEDDAITHEEVRQSIQGESAVSVDGEIDELVRTRYLKRLSTDRLRLRHRVFADVTVKFLAHTPELLAEALGDLLYVFAAKASKIRDRTQRDRRMMIRLLNHTLLVQLRLPPKKVDAIYASVQELLDEDFHFWLQRGAYAVERNDLKLGENYLIQARNCDRGEDDIMVLTEWGQLRLRLANSARQSAEATELGREGLVTLLEVAGRTGQSSPHTFAILARDGTEWLESCPELSIDERRKLAERSLTLLEFAVEHLRRNRPAYDGALKALPKIRKLAAPPDDVEYVAPML